MTRVLVVDDEPQILRALRINLRARDYEVHVASTGAEALEVAGRYPPDLVILDLGLPDPDGVEVIQGLRGWTKAPIIVLTEVWGPGYAEATGNLRLYMAQLRRKLEPDPARPRWLITEPGMGYRYQPSPENSGSPAPAPAPQEEAHQG
ncbi:MAG TPA: DNA-binding response regulator [Streptosporangiaceae bacterium]|nr:DNA-binding response regulator [Streptosporangiaceae bacterium]HEX5288621.1 DNA-binding response regulator [Streptosporangiaceae bacterium]